ncbi:GNAT family N-acetyltransferase [Achromobacter kerstersii]|uniref:GNAT family N-acetyltransferase n=1 Tax=Achromobacter kerstersii TaxID=1353890 RepID=UPI0006C25EAA|nr:GNAT family N-acetyltransferase [Achromobacter kerstersii]CUJ03949.1 Predicted acetyltransferase [Achromobacter kerstersii]
MIRPAQVSDLARLADIERSAAQRFRGTPMAWAADGEPLPLGELVAAQAAGLLWVALRDGQVCGFALARPMDGDLFLVEMSVALPAQGQGLGRGLMQAVLAHAHAAGRYGAVVLTTDRELPWNAPFYQRLGFVELAPPYSAAVHARLQSEADAGFDAARRCALAYPLRA